jgi:YidC/Oxa1 family membrane protein insertase
LSGILPFIINSLAAISNSVGLPYFCASIIFYSDMKMDRNQVIGFTLLGLLFAGFFYFTNKEQQAVVAAKQQQDSINAAKQPKKDTTGQAKDSIAFVQQKTLQNAGPFVANVSTPEQLPVLENELVKVTLSSKGAQVKAVELKKYEDRYTKQKVQFGNNSFDEFSYAINTSNTASIQTADLNFAATPITKNADGSQSIALSISDSIGRKVTHTYTLKPNDYRLGLSIHLAGANNLVTGNQLKAHWNYRLSQKEEDLSYERQQLYVTRMMEGDYDFDRGMAGADVTYEKPVSWFGAKQHFFNVALQSPQNFAGVHARALVPAEDSTRIVANMNTDFQIALGGKNNDSANLQFVYAPNDYKLLKSYDNGMNEVIDLGSGMWSFVKYLNRGIIKPVFDWLAANMSSLGWAIALLTLFIRLITSPLVYGSYKSGAKMKLLRPELEALKAKLGDDQQKYGVEQMKLFREAGASPLGGCIPTLLQIPIFFALYALFNNEIALRGSNFLWANNLAVYDAPIRFGFNIPILGDHLSLFTITACFTSFLISFYNMGMTPQQDNPVLKYMPYIFPFMMLFFFNKLPSALTWYYTVNNLLVLGLQLVIQKFIINNDTLRAQIAEARAKPKTKSKWQQKFEEMQAANERVQEQRKKLNQGK